jgi:hypothetical protein
MIMREEMEQGWYLIPNEKVIARKCIPFLSVTVARMGFRRTNLVDLYSMIKRSYHSPNNIEEMTAFSFPLEHDNFPKPDQYPFYYRLMNDWTVEKKSVIFLKDGPLFSENSNKVIVHSKIFVQSLLQQIWKPITVFSVLLGIVSPLLNPFGVI